ncbi:tRNA lysidine(34) synthetase TilS [Entomohabitans teleogrylli]|uniref:tRNA lysidine(34) synthetase TilS n=1 Tax=Entomohabitans teleogrylli TaxID=1384589 RepID=UPI00073D9E58|nr:tRNA lysidine(34) synthetase TilS [Entomohabitans teleogrylli]
MIPGHLQHYRHWLVAFSGGLDSTVLLHQLTLLRAAQPQISLRAAHIHHGISRFADDWAAHCQALCQAWRVPLEVIRVQLQEDGQGIEAQARAARYAALKRALRPGEVLATAQHLDDQCETLLLALKRGSGPAGLAAMPERLAFAGSELVRPLLSCSRAELERWADEHQLIWVDDDSNDDDGYDRNFLRLRVLPALIRRWPHFPQAAARSARLCGEQEQLLDELLAEQLAALIKPQGQLLIDPLQAMSEARRAALLRRWFAWHRAVMPSRAALQRLWDEVACSKADAAPRLRFGAFEVRRYQQALWWVKTITGQRETVIDWPDTHKPLPLPAGLGWLRRHEGGMPVRVPRADEPVSVRFQVAGHLHIVGRERGRTLKKLWQELGIPPWQRDTTPLLFYGEQLIAACGVFVTREGEANPQTCWHIDWQKESEQC